MTTGWSLASSYLWVAFSNEGIAIAAPFAGSFACLLYEPLPSMTPCDGTASFDIESLSFFSANNLA
jgi:hypothetical protein